MDLEYLCIYFLTQIDILREWDRQPKRSVLATAVSSMEE